MQIFHWVPSSGMQPHWSCIDSWVNMEIPVGAKKIFKRSPPGSVRYVWNGVVREFLDTGAEWMFSTHHDVAFVPGTLKRLLSWGQPFVNALVFMRNNPALPQVWQSYDKDKPGNYAMRVSDVREWFYKHPEYIRFDPFIMEPKPDDALYNIGLGFTATACTLINRQVFIDIRDKLPNQNDGYWFVCDNEVTGGGEDRRFYEYARQVGYTPYIDFSCVAGHIAGDIPTSSMDFIAWDSVGDFLNTGEPKAAKAQREHLEINIGKVIEERKTRTEKLNA